MVFGLVVQKFGNSVFYLSMLTECLRCGKLAHDTMMKIIKPHSRT